MVKLKDVGFDEFLELADYLESISEGGTQALIGRFFPFMSATEELELNYVIDTRDRSQFERFRDSHPEMEVDPEGRTEPSKKDYWEVHLKSIDSVHEMASKYLERNDGVEDIPGKPNTQIRNAKSLEALWRMPFQDPSYYVMKRKLFMDKHSTGIINPERLSSAEATLRSLGIAPNTFMVYLFAYCSSKKFENYRVFADHVLRRISLLGEDGNLKSESSRSFLEAIKRVSERNK
jgi:hypothetical protein